MEELQKLGTIVDDYLKAFNQMDLDPVMQYFAGDVLYQPGGGSEFHGVEAVRRAFLPQFSYVWGRMTLRRRIASLMSLSVRLCSPGRVTSMHGARSHVLWADFLC